MLASAHSNWKYLRAIESLPKLLLLWLLLLLLDLSLLWLAGEGVAELCGVEESVDPVDEWLEERT